MSSSAKIRRVLLLLFAVAGTVAIPVVCFKYLVPPYFWTGCGYLIIALVLTFFVTSTRSKVVLVNLFAIIVTVTGFEWYKYSNRHYKVGRVDNVFRVHDIIPGSRSNNSEYRLIGDSHPSPLANKKIAGFVVEQGVVPQRSVYGDGDKGQ